MLVSARHSVYMILGRVCVGPLCAYVSEHSWFVWVVSFGVCSVFVGASVCAVAGAAGVGCPHRELQSIFALYSAL